MAGCVIGGCVSLLFVFNFKKKERNDKEGGYLCQAWRNVMEVLCSFMMKRDGGGWVVQKLVILAWLNYWASSNRCFYYD